MQETRREQRLQFVTVELNGKMNKRMKKTFSQGNEKREVYGFLFI